MSEMVAVGANAWYREFRELELVAAVNLERTLKEGPFTISGCNKADSTLVPQPLHICGTKYNP
jgi:hypothetical protein